MSQINEHLWSGIIQRSESGDEREEDVISKTILDPVNGFRVVRKVTTKGKKFNWLDENGKYVSKDWFYFADDFSVDGFARYRNDGKYNFIDTEGHILLKDGVDTANDFSEGFAQVQKDGKYNFIDTTGKLLLNRGVDCAGDFYEGFAQVQKDGKWYFIDTTGKLLLNRGFDGVDDFRNGYAIVKKKITTSFLDDWKFNFIDNKGKLISKKWFYNIVSNFNEKGFALVDIDYKTRYFIDGKGKLYPTTAENQVLCEHLWSGIITRSETGKARKEDRILILGHTDGGKELYIPTEYTEWSEKLEDCKIIDLNTDNGRYIKKIDVPDTPNMPIYLCVFYNQEYDEDQYYCYLYRDGDDDTNMKSWMSGVSKRLRENDFARLQAYVNLGLYHGEDLSILGGDDDDESMDFRNYSHYRWTNPPFYSSYSDYSYVLGDAEYRCKRNEIGELDDMTEKKFREFADGYGYDFVNKDDLLVALGDYYDDDGPDEFEDEKDYAQKLVELGIIDNISDLRWDNYSYEYSKYMVDQLKDKDIKELVDLYLTKKDFDDLTKYIDLDELAKKIVKKKGPAKYLSTDGEELKETVNGQTFYFYYDENND